MIKRAIDQIFDVNKDLTKWRVDMVHSEIVDRFYIQACLVVGVINKGQTSI